MTRFDSFLERLAGTPKAQHADLAHMPAWRRRARLIARISLRFFWVYLLLLMATTVWVGAAGMDVYHRTEMPQFCNSCHEMGHNFDTWSDSRHGSIRCIDCHARPGISGYVQAKIAGTLQLYTHLTAKTIDDIHLEKRHEDIVSENCVRCHPETARAADRHNRVMAHKRHGELGLACVICHSAAVAHPDATQAKDKLAGIVETKKCFECHDGKHAQGVTLDKPKVAFAATAKESCEKCHPDATFGKEHGGGSECLDCHEVRPGQTHFQMDKQNQGALCAKCHDTPTGAKSTHKPFAQGKCGDCHRVMAPAYLFRFGPTPDENFCLRCHEDVAGALAMPNATTLTQFADGKDDRHRQHADDIGRSPDWCLKCHAGHSSGAERAMLHPKADDKDAAPGVYTATATGGQCTGACHDGDDKQYDRTVRKLAAPVPAAAAPTATEK
jgi:cytochrome c nitrite reductase small subunit